MDKYLEILPNNILIKGLPLQEGFLGYAFYAKEMLEISNILLERKIAVLGGDVLIKVGSYAECSPNGENWYLDYKKGDNYNLYVTESIKKMNDYIIKLSNKFPDFLYQASVATEIDLVKIIK